MSLTPQKGNNILPPQTDNGEIVLYKPNDSESIEVRVERETVWLTQAQMVVLFQSTKQNISLHIRNVYKENELDRQATVKEYLTVQKEGERQVKRVLTYYNLDVIISVGYRVKSLRGTKFRQWANGILKDYLLKGYSINSRINNLEDRMDRRMAKTEQEVERLNDKIDFYIQSSLPPRQGIFYDGQVYDAYTFVAGLVKRATSEIVLIDNYIDETVLTLLDKRQQGVDATIYTATISSQLQLDISRHNSQYAPIVVNTFKHSHDRFLCIDDEVYHIGASIKDLGKKWFAFSKMEDLTMKELVNKINGIA